MILLETFKLLKLHRDRMCVDADASPRGCEFAWSMTCVIVHVCIASDRLRMVGFKDSKEIC